MCWSTVRWRLFAILRVQVLAVSIGCLASNGYLRCGKSHFTFDMMCVITTCLRWILCGAANPYSHSIRCVLSPKKMIPSEISNGGVLSRNALPNIRGVFASLNGGRPNSSSYWVWSVSAVIQDIALRIDTMSVKCLVQYFEMQSIP